MTFYYNDLKGTIDATDKYDVPDTLSKEPFAWYEHRNDVQTVVIDQSFADARPTTTRYWFTDIPAITTVVGLENLNTSEVTDMHYMFAGCTKLTSIDVSRFETSKVTDMAGMFGLCSSLKEIDLSGFDTQNVTDMRYMFTQDEALVSVNLSGKFSMKAVRNCWSMFEDCAKLKEIWVNADFSIPEAYWDGSEWGNKVTTDDMFKACTSLPHYDATKVDRTLATLYQDGGYLYSAKKEPWAEYKNTDTSLTFYYDNQRYLKTENKELDEVIDIDITSTTFYEAWAGKKDVATKATFDKSFSDLKLPTLEKWFYQFTALTDVEGLSNLNLTEATSMSYMFGNCSALQSINLTGMVCGEKLTDMSYMFDGCEKLQSLAFPSGFNCSKVETMSHMLNCCFNLQSVDLTGLNTESVKNMAHMFEYCSSLTDIDLSTLNTQNVTDMSYMLSHCISLTSVKLKGLNTGNLRYIPEMFQECEALKELDLSSFNTEKVENMFDMFRGCAALKEIDLSSFNTAKVTDMSRMFMDCSALKALDLSDFNTEKVKSMYSMFQGCVLLKGLQLTSFNTENVTYMMSMFEGCTSLHALDLTTFSWLRDGSDNRYVNTSKMFSGCEKLMYIFATDYSMPTEVTNYQTLSADMFYGCEKLPHFVGTEIDGTHANKLDNGYFTLANQSVLPWVEVSDEQAMVFHNDNDYFAHCFGYDLNTGSESPAWLDKASEVKTVEILPQFARVRPTTCYQWFKNLAQVTDIQGIKNLVTDEVTNMAEMFAGCAALEKLDVTAFVTEKATTMSGMFDGCSTIKTLDLTGWNTQNVTDMTRMFYGGSALQTIFAGYGFTTDKVTDDLSVSMFEGSTQLTNYDAKVTNRTKATFTINGGCLTMAESTPWVAYDDKLQALTLHYGLRTVSTSTIHTYELGDDYTTAAWRNNNIKQVYIAKDMTEYRPTTLKGLFQGLDSLQRVSNLSYINYGAVTDMSDMFAQCFSLCNEVDFSDCDLSQVKDMSRMFAGCFQLPSVSFTNTATSAVTSTAQMFSGCTAIKSIDLSSFYTANVTDMGSMFFGCESATSIKVNSFNTANVTDMSAMFAKCASLETINVASFNTANVKNMNMMFNNCSSVNTIYASSAFTIADGCTGMGMFYGCEKLNGYVETSDGIEMAKSITDGGYLTFGADVVWASYNDQTKTLTFHYDDKRGSTTDTETFDLPLNAEGFSQIPWRSYSSKIEKVVIEDNFANICPSSVNYYFYSMYSLKSIEGLQNLNTTNVTQMDYMFYDCDKLQELDLSHMNTANVTDMTAMFSYCRDLKVLNLKSFNTAKVTSMKEMFAKNSELKHILVSDEFKVAEGCASKDMFAECAALYKFDATQTDSAKAKYIADGGYFDQYTDDPEMWAAYYEDSKTLKFFYDNKRFFDLAATDTWAYTAENEAALERPWYESTHEVAEKAVFDSELTDKKIATLESFFQGYANLKTIDGLKNLNTDETTSMKRMFKGCSSLTKVDMSVNAPKVTSMESMFEDCSSLTSALSPSNTNSLTSMESMFQGCSSLTKVTLPNLTYLVTSMKYLFYDCSALTSIDLSKLEVPSLTTMEGMFFNCKSLKTVNANMSNTQRVTDMSYLFDSCSSLTDVDLSSLNTEAVTQMDYMFFHCDSLEKLNLQSFNTAKVTNAKCMFLTCPALSTIYVSDDFALSGACDGERMFNNCVSLPDYDQNNVGKSKAVYYSKGGYFLSANSKAWVEVSSPTTTSEPIVNIIFHYDDGQDVCEGNTYEMPTIDQATPQWITDINNKQAEDNIDYQINVKINSTFHEYQPTTCYKWFGSLKYVDKVEGLKYLNTSKVTNMSYMFDGGINIKELDLSHFNTENVTAMTCMFRGLSCDSLDLSSFNTSKVTDMTRMFSDCSTLKSINLSSFNTSNVISMEGMFANDGALKQLDLTSFDVNKVTDMSNMFLYEGDNEPTLTNVYVNEDYVLGNNCLANDMFKGNKHLPHFTVSEVSKTRAHYKEEGYLTLRRQFSAADTLYNADGYGEETTCYADVDFTDGYPYSSKFDFKFADDATASYSRTMQNSWATLCLPFAFNADQGTVRFYSIQTYDNDHISVTRLTGEIEAGTPVLAYVTDGELNISATAAAAVADAKQLTELKGAFAQTEVADKDYIIANDHFWNAGYLKEQNAAAKHVYVAPYRAYLTLDLSEASKPNSISINESETDGINGIDSAEGLEDLFNGAELYDLQGRRLTAPQRGVIIVRKGGVSHKVVVK